MKQTWVAAYRGDDALTRHLVLWHESQPATELRGLVSISIVKVGMTEPWKPAARAAPAKPPAREWLVRSLQPLQGPDLRPVELQSPEQQPLHFGYAIPLRKLKFEVLEPHYIDTTTVDYFKTGESTRVLDGFYPVLKGKKRR